MAEGKGFHSRDVIITFKVSEEEAEALKHIAEKAGTKVSALIRDFLFNQISLNVRDKIAIEDLANKAKMKTSIFVRDVILNKYPEMAKGIMFLFNFFKKYGKVLKPDASEKEKFFEVVDLGDKAITLYKSE